MHCMNTFNMDEAFLNDLLECSVCLEQLDGTSRVLPCQHTFCKQCLDEIVNSHKELRCPECRMLVETKVDDLPVNILLVRLLDGIKNSSQWKQTDRVRNASIPMMSQNAPPPFASHVQRPTLLQSQDKVIIKPQFPRSVCAKAVCTYEGKAQGELSFKKGDTITIHKHIDQTWCHGEVGGKYGLVPVKLVRVVSPLLSHIPNCKALYDFSVTQEEEQDCLAFNKGEIIIVIRRVDDNWAEGQLGEKIGIFPISFVEMNSAAKCLMKLMHTQPGPSRLAPPTPFTERDQTSSVSHSTHHKVALQASDSVSSATPSPSSSTPSPNTPPSSPNSPSPPLLHQVSQTSKKYCDKKVPAFMRTSSERSNRRHQERRHSFSSASSFRKAPQMHTAHKHSLEILSTIGGDILVTPKRTTSENITDVSASTALSSSLSPLLKDGTKCGQSIKSNAVSKPSSSIDQKQITAAPPATSLAASTTPSPPVMYVALYNYRPEKADELELKKGELYAVTEKCQDGWFKGTSVRRGNSGVFPGNYVRTAKTIGHFSPHSISPHNVRVPQFRFPQLHLLNSRPALKFPGNPINNYMRPNGTSVPAAKLANAEQGEKPTMPVFPLSWVQSPTAVPDAQSSCQLSRSTVGNEVVKDETLSSQNASPWLKSILNSKEKPIISQSMVASYPTASTREAKGQIPDLLVGPVSQSWHAENVYPFLCNPATSMTIASPPNVSLQASSSGTQASQKRSGKGIKGHKVWKERTREGLIKRFTEGRKTRIPVANFSCDNPTFVDCSSDVIHTRSGSCPSEVLSSSKPGDGKSGHSEVTTVTKLGSRILGQQSLVREKVRCIVPYPPNSEYELELKVGDIISVQKKREDGWCKGISLRSGKMGMFPASFVDSI